MYMTIVCNISYVIAITVNFIDCRTIEDNPDILNSNETVQVYM